VQKYYIVCARDRAIPLQRRMQQGVEWAGVRQLASDHSPMLSHPAELAAMLLRTAGPSAYLVTTNLFPPRRIVLEIGSAYAEALFVP
jgi:hypothetical protein